MTRSQTIWILIATLVVGILIGLGIDSNSTPPSPRLESLVRDSASYSNMHIRDSLALDSARSSILEHEDKEKLLSSTIHEIRRRTPAAYDFVDSARAAALREIGLVYP